MRMIKRAPPRDHVATIRQARRTNEPNPVWAAVLAELGGADGITIHLREDRRHIQDWDLEVLRKTVTVKLNLELAANPEIVGIACQIHPDQATLVPERREEVTTEGGLDVAGNQATATASFDVTVSVASLTNLTDRLVSDPQAASALVDVVESGVLQRF